MCPRDPGEMSKGHFSIYIRIVRRAVIRSTWQTIIMDHERDFLCDEAGLGNSVEKRRISHVYGWESGCLRFCCTAANQRYEENGDRPYTLRSNAKHVEPLSAAQMLLYVRSPLALAVQATRSCSQRRRDVVCCPILPERLLFRHSW